jgi:hypothetical protein
MARTVALSSMKLLALINQSKSKKETSWASVNIVPIHVHYKH